MAMEMKYKNTLKIGLIISIIALLLLSNVQANLNIHKITINEENDRISPLENQGLILSINRVRNRELLNKIIKPELSWKQKPEFYINITIDDLEYLTNTQKYKTWDSIGQDFRAIRDVEEEQNQSEITIKINSKEKNKKTYTTVEEINLIYSYKTGRWTGDDSFNDSDGIGHYIGKTFEIWFNIYQTDYDHDGIPYWTEINILETNPMVDDSKLDPDNDGIPTSWEWKWGYNPHIWDDHENLDPDIDGIENIEEYMMSKYFSNPYQPDIYIEVDMMDKSPFGWNHVLHEESKQIVIERFCQHNISVFFDDGWPDGPINGGGDILPFIRDMSWDSGMFLSFYKHHFADERKGVFRYLIMNHKGGYCGNSMYNNFDTIAINSNPHVNFIIRNAFTKRVQHITIASAVLHELGHSLGIGPNTIGGCDNISYINKDQKTQFLDTWSNYESVMNYYYIYDKTLVDYSDGSNDNIYDQNDWNMFYYPLFQIEFPVVCEPGVPLNEPGFTDNIQIILPGWNYSEQLTNSWIENNSNFSPVYPIRCNWMIYEKINPLEADQPSNRNIRVYVKPIVPISIWSLYKEDNI